MVHLFLGRRLALVKMTVRNVVMPSRSRTGRSRTSLHNATIVCGLTAGALLDWANFEQDQLGAARSVTDDKVDPS